MVLKAPLTACDPLLVGESGIVETYIWSTWIWSCGLMRERDFGVGYGWGSTYDISTF